MTILVLIPDWCNMQCKVSSFRKELIEEKRLSRLPNLRTQCNLWNHSVCVLFPSKHFVPTL